METNKIELSLEQKGLLASLAQETGEPVDALIDKALEELQKRMRTRQTNGTSNGSEGTQEALSPESTERKKPIWEQFAEAFDDIPDEELEKAPTDLAANVDHYVYGLPKRNL